MMIFWTVLLIVLVVVLARLLPGMRTGSSGGETPLERLQRRYAAGDISTSEYDERRDRL